jgi:hypothetical protein
MTVASGFPAKLEMHSDSRWEEKPTELSEEDRDYF